MSKKSITGEQRRRARELVNLEEAIQEEKERRARLRDLAAQRQSAKIRALSNKKRSYQLQALMKAWGGPSQGKDVFLWLIFPAVAILLLTFRVIIGSPEFCEDPFNPSRVNLTREIRLLLGLVHYVGCSDDFFGIVMVFGGISLLLILLLRTAQAESREQLANELDNKRIE